ncbi:MAG TPA: hypothetical protein VK324_07085, partial [Tepidisphaeraceae bacterium]|nr:hypothetical protein [Tepidisphaeraceae bacterium]
ATLPAGTPFKQAAGAIAALPTARTAAQQLPDFKIRQWRKGVTQLTSGGAVPGVAQIVVPAKPHARTDRVVTWSPRVGVRVFRAADAKQLCARPEMPEPPRGAAWVGDDVLVWSGTTLLRIAPEQDKVVWSMTIAGLPPVEPVVPPDGGLTVASVAGDGEDVGIDNGPGIVNGPVGIVRPQQFRAARNRMNALALMRQQQIEADRIAAAAAQGPEQWVAVRPVGDRVVASTSSGRLAGVDAAGGALAWQVRLADRAPDRLLTNDDFVVARVPGDAGSHVVAVDAYSGRPLGRRPFGNDTTPGPINLALADDGTLVYTLADRVGTKNLFDPWADGWRFPEPDAGAAYAFGGAARADQLVVGGGRIAALAGDGRNVHVFSLFTLRPVGSPLATGAEEAVVGLTLLGDRLYAVGPRKAKSFDLGGADEVLSELRLPESATIAESFVGQDHVVLLDTMGRVRQPDASQDRYRLLAYSRRLVEGGRESKALELSREIADDGILPTWHAVDGGFYYLTAGGVMKQVKGTGE